MIGEKFINNNMVTEVVFRKFRRNVSAADRYGSSVYYECQWPISNKIYFGYRWFHFLLLAGALLTSILSREEGLKGRWMIFLTNWALILYFSQAVFSLYLIHTARNAEYTGEPIKISVKILEAYGALHSTSVIIALGVSLIYWMFVYDPEIHHLDFVNIVVHASNSIIMLLDLLLVAHPVRFFYILFPLIFTLIYSIFNVIYFICGGTDRKGNHYVYKVIDWTKPINASLFILGGMFLLMVLFILIWFLTHLRRQIGLRVKAKSDFNIPQQDPTLDLPLA